MATSGLTNRNDLAWLANCYVAGELADAEATAFEARLANDEAACEAVAHAMELNLAVAAAFDLPPATLRPRPIVSSPTRWAGAAITAVAASAVAAASVALMVGHGSTTNGLARKDGTERLVAAWASGEAARNNAADDESIDVANEVDLEPPDWMLAALTVADVKDPLPGNNEVREN